MSETNQQQTIDSNLAIESTWYDKSIDEVFEYFNTPRDSGLTSKEVAKRREIYGLNQLEEKPRPGFFQLLLAQLNDFIVILLIVAAVISGLLGEWIEAGFIMLIVVLNAILGVVQESKAEEALAALKKMAAPETMVLRDGKRVSIPASELVPGDIVFLEAGIFVPADIRLVESANLRAEEATLTGESVPVQKNAELIVDESAGVGDRKNMVFSGTLINYGRGSGIVVATGMNTEIGRIASMLQTVEDEQTPLQQRLDQLGKTLGIAALAICGVIFVLGVIRSGVFQQGFSADTTEVIIESFMIAVSLAIAAVPEGLAAVVTISLALGMRDMVKRNALIRKLQAVETLGSVTVICSDKTGTLTENRMTVTFLDTANNSLDLTTAEERDVIKNINEVSMVEEPTEDQKKLLIAHPEMTLLLIGGSLCSDAIIEADKDDPSRFVMIGDPTEGALIVAAARMGLPKSLLERTNPRVAEVPFDSDRKRMTTIHRVPETIDEVPKPIQDICDCDQLLSKGQRYVAYTKGTADGLIDISTRVRVGKDSVPLDDEWRKRIEDANASLAKQGIRVLGVATTMLNEFPDDLRAEDVEHDLTFIGLVGMIDPARPEVKEAVETCRKAGIRPIMITGDHPLTARYIAKDLGISENGEVVTGAELEKISDEKLEETVKDVSIYARVSPEHKLRIVSALQNNNQIVAMTGDGVNDAPALKKADIGVAMGITGTDVAKGTADMVLIDDNYASIVAAVEQGRIIYSNIRKFVFFLISCNIAEILIIFLASLAGLPVPLTVIQLLWLNLLTDGAPALALAKEKGEPDIMDQPPRPKEEPIINKDMQRALISRAILQTSAVLAAFILGLFWHMDTSDGLAAVFQQDWLGVDVTHAVTMSFVTLSLVELFRANTVRSERTPLVKLGLFSNKYMQVAILISLVLLLLVVNVPFLQEIFDTTFLSFREWLVAVGLALVPSVFEEIKKIISYKG